MADRFAKLSGSNPFGDRPALNLDDLTGGMVEEQPQIVERIVEVEKVVEKQVEVYMPSPITEDAHGVTWVGNVGMTPTGLVIPESGISTDEWAALYNVLRDVKKSWQFLIGDWFAYGADNFRYSYAQIAEWTGYKESSVETFASVCRKVRRLIRVNSLDFGHHRAVSDMPEELQIQALNTAAERRMSVRDFRDYLGKNSVRRLPSKRGRKKTYNVIDKSGLNRLRKADINDRRKVAEQLRKIADELERGEE